jgi:hypothetical protein
LRAVVHTISRVPPLTPAQERTRDRVETLIGLMAPALTLVLAAGDRISRLVAPEDHEYYPVRPMAEEEKGRDSAGGIAG